MPGFVHDGVITLLERHPEILLELWASSGGPTHAIKLDVDVLPNELRITFGSNEVRHFRPDMVMRLLLRGRHHGTASLEVQGVRKRERALGWEIHQLLMQQLFGEIPQQFVVPLGWPMEGWVQRQIVTRPALRHMCVLGPSKVARIETIREARARPYHAALAVAVHRREATQKMCEVALRALSRLSDEFVGDYTRMVLAAVPRRHARELIMGVEARELQITAVEREGYLYNKAYDCGLRAGSRRGRKKGLEQGLELGLEQGLEQGLVTAAADLLEARGLEPADDLLARLSACKDHALLRRAAVLAATASSIDEIQSELWPKRSPTRSRKR